MLALPNMIIWKLFYDILKYYTIGTYFYFLHACLALAGRLSFDVIETLYFPYTGHDALMIKISKHLYLFLKNLIWDRDIHQKY